LILNGMVDTLVRGHHSSQTMKSHSIILMLIATLFTGCSSSYQGIKFRAQSPPIEEAFRKISLAITTDGYEIRSVEPSRFFLETSWRPLKEKEKSEGDVKLTGQKIESQLTVRLGRRGSLYDVQVRPSLRYMSADSTHEAVADVRHPLWEKWQRVLNSIAQKEIREED